MRKPERKSKEVFQTVPNSRNEGFSLIEVMCAILILGVALAGMVQGLTTALVSSKESELQTSAALLAAAQIESLRAEGYVTDGSTEGTCGAELPLYQWRQTVTPGIIDGLHEVQVIVEHSKTGKPIYELQTLLFEPPFVPEQEEKQAGKTRDNNKEKERRRR